jgi:hypothetical protein
LEPLGIKQVDGVVALQQFTLFPPCFRQASEILREYQNATPALMDQLKQDLIVFAASLPALQDRAVAAFQAQRANWTRASGRDSKMTPMTPMGQVTL